VPDATTPAASREAIPSIAYRPDLDGLRAIAIGLVMLAHFEWPITTNADIGVTAFFVLSGYLITTILVRDRERTGRIRLATFYRRRIIRLGPALIGVLGFTALLGLGGRLPDEWPLAIGSSLLYVSNWVQAGGVAIHPLGHTWTLAIEEQFYLVWPLLLLLVWRRAVWVALVVIAVAFVARLMTSGYVEYFSTITRVDAILIGCLVAFAQPRWPTWVAWIGLAALLLTTVVFAPSEQDVAIPIAIVATTLVIAGRLEPLGRLAPGGLRAYSLYLWSTPMTLLFGAGVAMAPVMTIAIAEVSFRLLERPVLRRGVRRPAQDAAPASPSLLLAQATEPAQMPLKAS
jgi:peptidoglycan/LPS O-acetylase OafA/YrhL